MTGFAWRMRCAAVWLWFSAVIAACHAQLPEEVRILSYNIHHGEGVDGKIDLPRIAEVINSAAPHIVAVQEVDQGVRRTDGVDQPAELARLTKMKILFGRNIDYDGGGYGTAVLSKLPVRSHERVKLRSFYKSTPDHAEQRAVQVVVLGEADEPGIVFLCTHLDYRPPDAERMASAATINRLADARADMPIILAGDLNAEPDSRAIRELAKRWIVAGAERSQPRGGSDALDLLTYPSQQPTKWIDYVMFRPANRWQVVDVRVLDEPVASDHRPLLAVLRRVD